MTNKEAIKEIEKIDDWISKQPSLLEDWCKTSDALYIATQALDAQPCEDCISRKAVLDLVADYDLSMGQVVKGIHALPPITPQRPKGKWIDCKCNRCNYEVMKWNKTNFCPNCGSYNKEEEDGTNY